MKALMALLVLLTAWPCEAQIRRRAFGPKPAGGTFPLPPGIQFRWISTNLFDPVTNWVDTVSGSWWIQNTAANQPRFTNGTGVHFLGTSSQFMNATNLSLHTSNAVLFIVKPDAVTGTRPIVGFDVSSELFGLESSKWYNVNGSFGTPVADLIYDVFFSSFSVASVLTPGSAYTNGVVSATGKSLSAGRFEFIGKGFNTVYYTGTIYEVIVWSNALAFTASDVANIHAYSTNRWPHSP